VLSLSNNGMHCVTVADRRIEFAQKVSRWHK